MTDFAASRVMMVDTQVRPSDVTQLPVIEAMLSIPREDFVPAHRRPVAYLGENMDIGQGRALLAPRTLAKMVNALDIGPDDLLLDLGCGYGYSTAVLAWMAQAVVAVEEVEELAAEAQARLAGAEIFNAAVISGPLVQGHAAQAPYDAILINGAVEEIPDTIADQLRDGGRIVALFQERTLGVVRLGHKVNGVVNWRFAFNAHAPLLVGFTRQTEFSL